MDRADDVVPVARVEQARHAVLAPGNEVGLDPQAQIGVLAHELAVGVEVVARVLAPHRVVPDVERLTEAVDVLAHAQLLDAALRSPRRGRPRRCGREPALRRVVQAVLAQVDVVVGQHRAAEGSGGSRHQSSSVAAPSAALARVAEQPLGQRQVDRGGDLQVLGAARRRSARARRRARRASRRRSPPRARRRVAAARAAARRA